MTIQVLRLLEHCVTPKLHLCCSARVAAPCKGRPRAAQVLGVPRGLDLS